ncbi:hypothetical protein AMST5_02164 [freshwater sediment metagenome]|uniref:Uncharacterized protein n=1 Tax=freshwater sediment metagenome TaxID=556182 RepID=A0AA48M0L3_9ZZZZ
MKTSTEKVLGIHIVSRHEIQKEVEAMERALISLPDYMWDKIFSVWCDSNAQFCYSIILKEETRNFDLDDRDLDRNFAAHVAENFERYAIGHRGERGHNGITVYAYKDGCEGEELHCQDPWWPDDEGMRPKDKKDDGDM